MRSGVVYSYTCSKCNLETYIGSTSRLLHVRVCSHKGLSYRTLSKLSNPEPSMIGHHSKSCGSEITMNDFKILGTASCPADLRILESLYIKFLSPTLNKDVTAHPHLLVKFL